MAPSDLPPPIPATASGDFSDFRLRVGIGTVGPTEEKPWALMAQSDAGPRRSAALQNTKTPFTKKGLTRHKNKNPRDPITGPGGLLNYLGSKFL